MPSPAKPQAINPQTIWRQPFLSRAIQILPRFEYCPSARGYLPLWGPHFLPNLLLLFELVQHLARFMQILLFRSALPRKERLSQTPSSRPHHPNLKHESQRIAALCP